jgi:TetR/AcrR family transcriptional regulator
MSTSHEELRAIALVEFARAGYGATSLQRIAELAGLSKSSVLYHFASKEALLEAAISPALVRFESMVDKLEHSDASEADRAAFIADFVDLLIEHTLEVHMFINQAPSLEDVLVFDRANALAVRVAAYFASTTHSALERMRFGIALGGAAYTMASQQQYQLQTADSNDETRVALITIVTELLSPVPVRSTTP